MNKLIFTLKKEKEKDLVLSFSNLDELKAYLDKNYYFCEIKLKDEIVILREKTGYQIEIASLKWDKNKLK